MRQALQLLPHTALRDWAGRGSGEGPRQSSTDQPPELRNWESRDTRLLEFTRQCVRKEKATQRQNLADLWRSTPHVQQSAEWCMYVRKPPEDGKRKNHPRSSERGHCLALTQSREENLFLPARLENLIINEALHRALRRLLFSSKRIISPRLNLALVLPNKS